MFSSVHLAESTVRRFGFAEMMASISAHEIFNKRIRSPRRNLSSVEVRDLLP